VTRRLLLVVLAVLAATGAAAPPVYASQPPVYAYYYIWFNAGSWSRAKTDYPLLGRYASDQMSVMRRHVRAAKRAGIDGFIVSWKGTAILNGRLEQLMRVADEEHFRLAIIYEGLDFLRDPLPTFQVAADLDLFRRRYASDPAFRGFGKPVVIWSGTWRFSRADIRRVVAPRRNDLLILASEHSSDAYERVADLVDGDAYYWGAANPYTYPGYARKLEDMGRAVHQHDGLWIPPAAPGFDARLVGGHTVVPRRGGDTFRRELDAATASSPDLLGVVSWNEFSENTHIEPSVKFGTRYLAVLADVLGAPPPDVGEWSSDAALPGADARRYSYGTPLLMGIGVLTLVGLFALAWRRSRLIEAQRRARDTRWR
jgi:hypothetical protein